jgi:hypothetical protein
VSIEFDCMCGARYRVKDRNAGRAFQCRACQASVIVPDVEALDLGIRTGNTPPPSVPAPDAPVPDSSWSAPAIVFAQRPPSPGRRATPQRVVVVDFDMPFSSLVWLLIKLSLAAIPAMIVVWAISVSFLLLVALLLSAAGLSRF